VNDRILLIFVIVALVILSVTGFYIFNSSIMVNSYIENSLYGFKICNSDNINNLDECKEVWDIYYLKDGELGYEWFTDKRTLGKTYHGLHIIFVENHNIIYYEPVFDRHMTIFEHEVEHMKCGCNWHNYI